MDYTAPLPQKLNQDRRTTNTVGHQVANTRRPGANGPMLETGSQKNVDLQPEPHGSPTMPAEENGFAPLNGDLPPADDAQSQQVDQPPLDIDVAGPPIAATTEEPPTSTESESVPEGEAGATGGVEKPQYAGLTPETSAHPRGYPQN